MGVPVAFWPALPDVALTVRVGGHVGSVDGEIGPVTRQLLLETGDDGIDAALQLVPVGPHLFREAVGGVDARRVALAAQDALKLPVLTDQGDHLRPGRDRVDGLRQAEADHRADRVAGAARPAGSFKFLDQAPDLGRIKDGFQGG